MVTRIYVRASTKDQDAERALQMLKDFANGEFSTYIENYTGTKLNRPVLNKLLEESNPGDILLVESVDRLSRLSQDDFSILKEKIKSKGLKLIIHDLPTTHINSATSDKMTNEILNVINSMLIDLLATMARLDNEKRKERIKQGLERAGYKPTGKKPNLKKHERIKVLLAQGAMTKEEIALAVGVGVATVYRVQKQLNPSVRDFFITLIQDHEFSQEVIDASREADEARQQRILNGETTFEQEDAALMEEWRKSNPK